MFRELDFSFMEPELSFCVWGQGLLHVGGVNKLPFFGNATCFGLLNHRLLFFLVILFLKSCGVIFICNFNPELNDKSTDTKLFMSLSVDKFHI